MNFQSKVCVSIALADPLLWFLADVSFFLFQTVGTCIVEECKENKLWEMTKKIWLGLSRQR